MCKTIHYLTYTAGAPDMSCQYLISGSELINAISPEIYNLQNQLKSAAAPKWQIDFGEMNTLWNKEIKYCL